MTYLLKSLYKIASVQTLDTLNRIEREAITQKLGELNASSDIRGLIIDHRRAHIEMTIEDAAIFAESVINLHDREPLLFIFVVASPQNRFIIDASVALAAARGVPISVYEDANEALLQIKRRFPEISASRLNEEFGDGDSPLERRQNSNGEIIADETNPETPNAKEQNTMTFLSSVQPEAAETLAAKGLSQRESQCLLAAANGMTEKETARLLGISPNTVSVHIANCRVKLNARNKLAAVIKGIGLIDEKTWCTHCQLLSKRAGLPN